MFLRKAGRLSEIVVKEEVFDLANMIEKQYVIQLVETLKFAIIVNRVIASTIETWHT